ncbi:MAG: ISAzo13-like element transposase-related protein [Candidatus Rokuibacteriota bacterium]
MGPMDLTQDAAVVNVGVSHDTAEFAVASIRRWWRLMGKRTYPTARRLLISADAGGSNGSRLRAWKTISLRPLSPAGQLLPLAPAVNSSSTSAS